MPSVHNNGSGSSEPDPQTALNTAAIAQNALIAKMDTLQAGEVIPEAGSVNVYGGRQWISLSDNVEVPDPVSIAILEASDDFEELTSHPDVGYALRSAEAPFLQNPSGSGSILFEEFTETFTPHASGEYTFTYSASEIVRLVELVS